MDQTIETLEREWDQAERRYNRAYTLDECDCAAQAMDEIEAIVDTMSTEDQDRFYGRS